MGQLVQLHPHELLPFFLSFTSLYMIAETITRSTIHITIVAMLSEIKPIINETSFDYFFDMSFVASL